MSTTPTTENLKAAVISNEIALRQKWRADAEYRRLKDVFLAHVKEQWIKPWKRPMSRAAGPWSVDWNVWGMTCTGTGTAVEGYQVGACVSLKLDLPHGVKLEFARTMFNQADADNRLAEILALVKHLRAFEAPEVAR